MVNIYNVVFFSKSKPKNTVLFWTKTTVKKEMCESLISYTNLIFNPKQIHSKTYSLKSQKTPEHTDIKQKVILK